MELLTNNKGLQYQKDESGDIVTKQCPKCLILKPTEDYYKDKNKFAGCSTYCKGCKTTGRSSYKKEVYLNGRKRVEKKTRNGNLYYENTKGEVVEKQCSKCKEIYNIDQFHDNGKGKPRSYCLICGTKGHKAYVESNKDKFIQYEKERYEKDKEVHLARNKEWYSNNKSKARLIDQRRRARYRSLPNDLTDAQRKIMFVAQGNECILTGDSDLSKMDMEHFIPLSSGFGGTTWGNCYYMDSSLNYSKHNKNPFEWIRTQREDIQERFHKKLVPMLAKRNQMNVEEFTEYVNSCFVVTAGV
jgi:hypothetical protein